VAPFSYFSAITNRPPLVGFSVGTREGGIKDTLRNLRASRDFVVNVVDEPLLARTVQASGDWPEDVSEFDLTGLTPAPSERVKSPRVSESPVSLECRLEREIALGEATLVVGEIVCAHVDERGKYVREKSAARRMERNQSSEHDALGFVAADFGEGSALLAQNSTVVLRWRRQAARDDEAVTSGEEKGVSFRHLHGVPLAVHAQPAGTLCDSRELDLLRRRKPECPHSLHGDTTGYDGLRFRQPQDI